MRTSKMIPIISYQTPATWILQYTHWPIFCLNWKHVVTTETIAARQARDRTGQHSNVPQSIVTRDSIPRTLNFLSAWKNFKTLKFEMIQYLATCGLHVQCRGVSGLCCALKRGSYVHTLTLIFRNARKSVLLWLYVKDRNSFVKWFILYYIA
jgi:hypothetical protein